MSTRRTHVCIPSVHRANKNESTYEVITRGVTQADIYRAMLRRKYLTSVGIATAMSSPLLSSESAEIFAQTESELTLDEILSVETVTRDIAWIKRTLDNALPRYWEQPSDGIYHIGPDTEYRIPKSYQTVKLYANLFHRQLNQVYEHNRYDCDNFAFDLRDSFTRMDPFINSVGVMVDTQNSHAYNVIVVDEESQRGYGSAHMWEPQSATEADYQTNRGVLIL